MFNEKRFNKYFKEHYSYKYVIYDMDLERLKKELLDLSKTEIEGYNTEETTALREYFGVTCEPKYIKNLTIHCNDKIISQTQINSYFNNLNMLASKRRNFTDKILKAEKDFDYSQEMIESVDKYTVTELYKMYGLAARKIIKKAQKIEKIPKSEIDILEFEKNFDKKLSGRVLMKIKKYLTCEQIICKDYIYYEQGEKAYNRFIKGIFSSINRVSNEYMDFMDEEFRHKYPEKIIENSVVAYMLDDSKISNEDLREIRTRIKEKRLYN